MPSTRWCLLSFTLLFVLSAYESRAQQMPAPRVQLNEFMAAPASGDPEYVELAIGGTSPLAPGRLALRDVTSAWRTLPGEAAPLMPGDFVVVTPDTSLFSEWYRRTFPGLPAPRRTVELRPWPALNNGGDSLGLALDGRQTERLGYTSSQVERGRSLERVQTFLPAHAVSNWSLPADGAGSPGRMNTVFEIDQTAPSITGVEQLDSLALRLYFSEPLLPDDVRQLEILVSGTDTAGPRALPGNPIPTPVFTEADVRLTSPLFGEQLHISGLRDPTGNTAPPSSHPVHGAPVAGDLLITEVLLRGSPDFVEILVQSDRHITLRHVRMYDDSGGSEPIRSAGPLAAHLVHPGQILTLDKAIPTIGHTLVLRTDGAAATVLDSIRVSADMEDPRFRSHTGRSLVRTGPGPADWASSLFPPTSPGDDTAATLRQIQHPDPIAHALIMTEVLYDPLDDPSDGLVDQIEFLEWTNGSQAPVSLFGAFMTWEISERGTSDTLRLGYQPVLVAPGESVVAFQIPSHRSGEESPAGALRDIWPDTRSTALTLPVRRSLGLVNSGRSITLHARDHTALAHDAYSPDDHHAAIISGKGRSLVRMRTPTGFAPWTTSTAQGGASPGRTDSHGNGDEDTLPTTDADSDRPSARLSPTSFYPEHPELGGQTLIHLHIPLDAGPRVVRIVVRDLHAHVVRIVSRGLLVHGPETLSWDGRRDDGTLLPAGPYVVEITVTSPGEQIFRLPVALLRR